MALVVDIPKEYVPKVFVKPGSYEHWSKTVDWAKAVDWKKSTESTNQFLKFVEDARAEYGKDVTFVFPEGSTPVFQADLTKLTRSLDLHNIELKKGAITFDFLPDTAASAKVDLSGANLEGTVFTPSGGNYNLQRANLQNAALGRLPFREQEPALDFSSANVQNLSIDVTPLAKDHIARTGYPISAMDFTNSQGVPNIHSDRQTGPNQPKFFIPLQDLQATGLSKEATCQVMQSFNQQRVESASAYIAQNQVEVAAAQQKLDASLPQRVLQDISEMTKGPLWLSETLYQYDPSHQATRDAYQGRIRETLANEGVKLNKDGTVTDAPDATTSVYVETQQACNKPKARER